MWLSRGQQCHPSLRKGARGGRHPEVERAPLPLTTRAMFQRGVELREPCPGASCAARHLSRGGSGAESRATREPRRATVPNGLRGPGPCRGPLRGTGSTFSEPQVAQEHSRGWWLGGGGGEEATSTVRAPLSSVRQVPCPQHLYLSPAHHPHACSQSWKRGVAPPTPPRNRPTLGPGAPGRTRLSYWDPPAEIPLTLPCK